MHPVIPSTTVAVGRPLASPTQPKLWSPIDPHNIPRQKSAPQQSTTSEPGSHPLSSPPLLLVQQPGSTGALTSTHQQPIPLICSDQSQINSSSGSSNSGATPRPTGLVGDCYASLLGFAETFRTMNPPNMRLAVHCLKAALNLKLPANLEARTHLQLGRLLFHYSKSDEQTQLHLEKARQLGAHLRANDDCVKFEAASLLAEFFERKDKRYEATCIMKDAFRSSFSNPYWHCRILFDLAKAHAASRDVNTACNLLAEGAQYAQSHHSDYTCGLFLLSKCMLLLSSRQMPEVTSSLSTISRLMESFRGTSYQRESLNVFHLILSVSYYLIFGQAKSARPIMRQLHQSIQQLAAMDEASAGTNVNEIDRFQWMPREHMVILVYLITVIQATQAGLLDRAKRSAEKALTQIEKLSVFDTSPLLTIFHLSLLEHTAMGRLVMGVQTAAAQDIGQACRICQSNPALMCRRLPQLRTLIGLYAMSMNCMDQAEKQFKLALKAIVRPKPLQPRSGKSDPADTLDESSSLSIETKTDRASGQPGGPRDALSVLICLNLALVHIRKGNTAECEALLNEVFSTGSTVLESCYCLRAAGAYVRAFQAFCDGRLSEAKEYLRETVRVGNEEELLRLSASAFITMGQIHLNEQNNAEGHKMVSAAIQVANRLPDICIQLWATALLKSVASMRGDAQEETFWFTEHDRYSKVVISEHVRAIAAPEHRLIDWVDGPLPPELPTSSSIASTSDDNKLL